MDQQTPAPLRGVTQDEATNIGANTTKIRILCVDDQAIARQLLADILSEYFPSAAIICAADGASAWELAQALPLQLVITDYRMPGMNGLELTMKLHAQQPSLPIILCSADREVVNTAFTAGAVAVLHKPVIISLLLGTLTDVLHSTVESQSHTIDRHEQP